MINETIREISIMRYEDKFGVYKKASVMKKDSDICSPILTKENKLRFKTN